jgi:hypothetical protein
LAELIVADPIDHLEVWVAAVLVDLDLALSLHNLREDCVDAPVHGRRRESR